MRYRAIPDFYDAEYGQQEMLQEDVPFFLNHLRGRQDVLELAVGTGRAAIPIAQAGHRVVGVDNDPRMLALADQKRQVAGLSAKQLSLHRCDILKLDLKRRFDWACILFNTFMVFTTLAQQDRALAAIRRHLKPRGRFWLDIFHPDMALLARSRSKGLEPTLFYEPRHGRTVFKTIDIYPQPARQLQRVVFNYTWFDADGQQQRAQTAFDLTFIFPRELQLLLERNGFEIEHLYGSYDGSALRDDSPRMIACCRKMFNARSA